MNVVWTSISSKEDHEFNRFNTRKDWLDSLLLSVSLIKKRKEFDKCILWCDEATEQYIGEDKRIFPFDEIHVVGNIFDWLLPVNWAYPKVWVYAQQTEPFMHIDTDAFFNEKGNISKLFQYRFLFQSDDTSAYSQMFEEAKILGILPAIINKAQDVELGINAGIFVCTRKEDLSIIELYHKAVLEYIQKQQPVFHLMCSHWCQPCFFEQLFIKIILDELGLKKGVDYGVLIEEDVFKQTNQYGFTHFLSASKKKPENVNKIRLKLQTMNLN